MCVTREFIAYRSPTAKRIRSRLHSNTPTKHTRATASGDNQTRCFSLHTVPHRIRGLMMIVAGGSQTVQRRQAAPAHVFDWQFSVCHWGPTPSGACPDLKIQSCTSFTQNHRIHAFKLARHPPPSAFWAASSTRHRSSSRGQGWSHQSDEPSPGRARSLAGFPGRHPRSPDGGVR